MENKYSIVDRILEKSFKKSSIIDIPEPSDIDLDFIEFQDNLNKYFPRQLKYFKLK
jgi:hypothetical protein